MSVIDLRALLADTSQCGAYFVDARDREAIVEAANALGFAVAHIDLHACRDKAEVLAQFALALRFPEWFGGNWDALADCLDDLSWWPAEGYVLVLEHAGAWRDAAADDFGTLLDILNDSARNWASDGVAFWALLPLPTAELGNIED